MPEASQVTFSFKEIATALVKAQDLHEGIWGVFINFGIQANNIGPNENELRPTAMIPILTMGLMKFDKETNLSVDAAKVNPRAIQTKLKKTAPN
jgi:hypothetical protein